MPKKTILFIIIGLVVVFGGSAYLNSRSARSTIAPAIPDVLTTKEVVIKNGETYNLSAGYVMKTIGGKKVKMLAYNGMIPGPTLRVNEGDQVTIHFTNNTDMQTLLHSHGVRMDSQSDGTQLVQKEMLPGESFDYQLKFDDPGAYWYHPHVRADKQQALGLYGAYVVTPKEAGYWAPADHEEVLFLSDILMEGGAIAPFSDKYVTHAMMGRFGNTQMVNGETAFKMKAEPGEVFRLYLVNAASVRTFNFSIMGAKMKLVGSDNRRFEKEILTDAVTVAPSERMVVDVYFPNAGTYQIENITPLSTYHLGTALVSGAPVTASSKSFEVLRENKFEVDTFAPLRRFLNTTPDKSIRLTAVADMTKIMGFMGGGMSGMGAHTHGVGSTASGTDTTMTGMMSSQTPPPVEWEDNMGDMNTFSTSDTIKWIIRDEETGKENMDIAWKFKKDSLVKIRIINDATSMHPMQHPVHFHGNRFVVLSTNGIANEDMAWKDTTQVKTSDVVDILLETSNPGTWMAHCHILEHLHSGMMLGYDVI